MTWFSNFSWFFNISFGCQLLHELDIDILEFIIPCHFFSVMPVFFLPALCCSDAGHLLFWMGGWSCSDHWQAFHLPLKSEKTFCLLVMLQPPLYLPCDEILWNCGYWVFFSISGTDVFQHIWYICRILYSYCSGSLGQLCTHQVVFWMHMDLHSYFVVFTMVQELSLFSQLSICSNRQTNW